MKIAMIGHKRIPSREGGVEVVVEELATRMVKEGHEVDVYNRKGSHVSGKMFDRYLKQNLKEYKGVHIITIPTFQNGKLNAIVYSMIATCRALFGKYDVIHFHAEGSCALLWIPHIFGIRTIATIHGLDWKREKWGKIASKYLKYGEKTAVKYADEIIVLSKNNQKYFKNVYKRETIFIPNGIEEPVIKEVDILKERFGLEKDGYILFLARIVPEKGLHYLLEAYSKIDNYRKLVVAGGNSHSRSYANEMEKYSEKDKRIIFTGFVEGKMLHELYSNAYFYVLPSDVEGMPISLLEAMSYGNCCLVSDLPENLEVVEDKAINFKNGNINDLKIKLEILLNDKKIVERYKKIVKEFILRKYEWNKVVKNTILLYTK